MDRSTELQFNPSRPMVMYVDMNSCFATIEQQANPLLRGKPIAVTAYSSPHSCILAPSIEAKKLGIRVGMSADQGKKIYPHLITLVSDPDKYRYIHFSLRQLLASYTPDIFPKSIDEFMLHFDSSPSLNLHQVALDIKHRITSEVGDYLTVSIGIGPNQFLAKVASNLHKPDGLEEINKNNYLAIYDKLSLTDLPGIGQQNAKRLNFAGIYSVKDFFNANLSQLHHIFKTVLARRWYTYLRGWENAGVVHTKAQSFSHIYSLPKAINQPNQYFSILCKLVEKTSFRMRKNGFQARGIQIGVLFRNHQFLNQTVTLGQPINTNQDIYYHAKNLFNKLPLQQSIRTITVSCFHLSSSPHLQLNLFDDSITKNKLSASLDNIKRRWGQSAISPASMIGVGGLIPELIAFDGQVNASHTRPLP